MLDIVYSNTIRDSSEHVLSLLKCRDKKLRHIVFTPDRANLIYQSQIFDILDEECLFDVDVTTISRFASKFNDKSKVLTKQGGIAIVKKILLENKKNLKVFAKSVDYNGFALSIFESICMFKSCRITPDKIAADTASRVLNDKLNDLKFVYEKYEEYLSNDYTDSFSVLNLCASKINKDFSDTVFYFVGFDDFTKQALFLIEKMAKYSKNVYISLAYSTKDVSNNYGLYDASIFADLIDMCKTNNIRFDVKYAKPSGAVEHTIMKKNLFGYDVKTIEKSSHIGVCKYENAEQEVEGTITYLRYLLQKHNLKYSDFTIVVPDMDRYKQLIVKNMKKYNIVYYLDETGLFSDNIVSRYVSSIVNIVDDYDQIFNIIKMPFVDVGQEQKDGFQNTVQKFGLRGSALLDCESICCDFVTQLKQYIEQSKQCACVHEYLSVLNSFLQNVAFAKMDECAEVYYMRNNIEQYKKFGQALNVLNRVVEELDDVLGTYECSHVVFAQIFASFVDNINLTLPPIVVDSVFVGDMQDSFLQKTKYTFVLGCNEGSVPSYSAELGIFSDKEIGLMPKGARLNPTIVQINKRKKLKVFENLTGFGEYLLISYTTSNGKSKMYQSSFVGDIQTLFDVDACDMSWIDRPYAAGQFNEKSAVFNNLSQEVVDENFAALLRDFGYIKDEGFGKYLATLNVVASQNVLDEYAFENKVLQLKQKVFLKSGKVGVSEIERYNACPYKHFVEYGLKIRDKKSETFDAIDNGVIIHEFLRSAVPTLQDRIYTKEEIWRLVEKHLTPVLVRDEYAHLTKNVFNKANIKALKNECARLVKGLLYQLHNTKFVQTFFEKKFALDLGCAGENNVTLVGVIDRVDMFDNFYIVVDYKTGSTTMNDFTDIKSGKKWQLVVYTYALSDSKLKPAGCFYLPIKNSFSDQNNSPYQMQGVLNNDADVLYAMDTNLITPNTKSKIVPVESGDTGIKENAYYKNMCLNSEQFEKLSSYVMARVKQQLEKISSGDIVPRPLGEDSASECKFCKYRGLCGFDTLYANKHTKIYKCRNLEQLLGEVADE